jgi:hypothetical protein
MQKPGQKVAMISSTAIDLPDHRKQVFEACLCEDVFPDGMESLPARDTDAITASMEMVNRADIYIGIFAWRYGYIPKGHKISITEMEFHRAVKRRIPILVFLIHKDHPITIEMVETSSSAQRQIKKLKQLACKGRSRCEFRSPAELRAEVIHALSALRQREMQSRSPVDAIRAEKKRLEDLDPKASVQITADARSIQYHVEFPNKKLEFLNKLGEATLKAFFEKGQSFQIKAKDIPTDISPVLNSLLNKAGDSEITVQPATTFKGCLQLAFRSPKNEPHHVQTDGEWTLAPKRAVFRGQLSDSPFYIEYFREAGGNEKQEQLIIKCKFVFNVWRGQPLLGLAYFLELYEFMHCSEFSIRSFIRGNQVWPPENLIVTDEGRKRAIEALEWLEKARQAARYLGANPPFPQAETINANEAESKDVQLMIKLIEAGVHEQNNAGQIVALSCDNLSPGPEIGKKELTANWTEPFRKINFFGLEIPFGPLVHTWTDLELVATRPLDNNRTEITFKGGAKSIWKIELKRPS